MITASAPSELAKSSELGFVYPLNAPPVKLQLTFKFTPLTFMVI